MKKAAWLLLAVVLLLNTVLTGCSTNPDSSNTQTQGNSKELNVLKIGVAALPQNMDPALNVGNVGIRIHFNVFETLLLADQKNNFELKPMLASKWKRIDDYTVEFTLKKGIKFHNGDELKAKDVQFSFNRLREKLPGVELAASLLSVIKEVQIVDDYTVRIITNIVDPILEDRIASSWGSWIIPADYLAKVGNEAFAAKPVGTGPFKVVSYSPAKIVLERFDGYWGDKPNVKRIEYILYPETASRMTALITGEVDMITQLPPDQIPVIEKEKNLEVKSLNISNMHVLIYNTQSVPLKDKKLRQALSLAIDRQLLCDTLWKGKAIVPKGSSVP